MTPDRESRLEAQQHLENVTEALYIQLVKRVNEEGHFYHLSGGDAAILDEDSLEIVKDSGDIASFRVRTGVYKCRGNHMMQVPDNGELLVRFSTDAFMMRIRGKKASIVNGKGALISGYTNEYHRYYSRMVNFAFEEQGEIFQQPVCIN